MSSLWDGVLACTTASATGTCAPTAAELALWLALAATVLGLAVAGSRRGLTAVATLRARALAPGLYRRLAHWVRPRSM